MPDSPADLQQKRLLIIQQISQLGDFRPGSITSTTGRCGKLNCRCHQPGQPGHGPNLRFTSKVLGKSVTESLSNPAAVRKAQSEIEEFRKYQQLNQELIEVSVRLCRVRPVEEDTKPAQEKKRKTLSSKKSHEK